MKTPKLFQLGSALVLTLSTLLSVSIPLAHAATSNCTWTDASGSDNNFSTAGNWSCSGTTPGNGDLYNLTFSNSAAGVQPIDNIASLSVGTITFQGNLTSTGGYLISTSSSSNSLNIAGGITDSSTGGSFNEIDASLTLGADQAFSAGSSSSLTFGDGTGTLNVGTHALTLNNALVNNPVSGSGSLVINNSSSGTVNLHAADPFTGAVTVSAGTLFVENAGGLTNASSVTVASGAALKGNGGVSSAVISSGGTVAPGDSPGCLKATNLTLNGTYAAEIGGTTACTAYDQIHASGTVNLSGTLQVSLVNGFSPGIGQSFKLIDNTGTNPVTGTFSGLAQGSTFTVSGNTFQISYQAGDGNDVVVTVITPVTAAGAAAGNAPKSPDTGLAVILANPLKTLFITSLLALGLCLLARRLKPAED